MPHACRRKKHVERLIEVAGAWAAPDVFVVSIAACVLQIEQFSSNVLGSKCENVDRALAEGLSKWFDGMEECYRLKTELLGRAWPLLSAAILWWVASWVAKTGLEQEQVLEEESSGESSEVEEHQG
jgi:hypothetical protein